MNCETNKLMINISIKKELCLGGTCGCDPKIIFWEDVQVSPKELVRLINRCETIRLPKKIQTMKSE